MADNLSWKDAFRPREWMMSILLVLLTTLLVESWTTTALQPNGDIVDFVSLASAVTSILLALVAIIITVSQGLYQRLSSDNIETQILRLGDTVDDMEISEESFSKQLERLDEIADQMGVTRSRVVESQAKLEEMDEILKKLNSQKGNRKREAGASLEKPVEMPLFTDEQVQRMLRLLEGMVTGGIWYVYDKNREDRSYTDLVLSFSEVFSEMEKEAGDTNSDAALDKGWAAGLVHATFKFLNALSIVEISGTEDGDEVVHFSHEGLRVLLDEVDGSGSAVETLSRLRG